MKFDDFEDQEPKTIEYYKNALIETLNKHAVSLMEISRLKALLEEHNIEYGECPYKDLFKATK